MRRWKALVIGALVLALVIGTFFLPVRSWFEAVRGSIEALGPAGPLVYVLCYAVLAVCLVPGTALTIGAGALFGLWKGLVVVLIGANLGALCSFLLARTLLRERVARWAASHPKFEALDRAIGREGFKTVFLARLSPVFPFTVLNYLLGLTKVRPTTYLAGNILGMTPGTFVYIYLGYLGPRVGAEGVSVYERGLLVVGLLATVAVIVVVTRAARRALGEATRS